MDGKVNTSAVNMKPYAVVKWHESTEDGTTWAVVDVASYRIGSLDAPTSIFESQDQHMLVKAVERLNTKHERALHTKVQKVNTIELDANVMQMLDSLVGSAMEHAEGHPLFELLDKLAKGLPKEAQEELNHIRSTTHTRSAFVGMTIKNLYEGGVKVGMVKP